MSRLRDFLPPNSGEIKEGGQKWRPAKFVTQSTLSLRHSPSELGAMLARIYSLCNNQKISKAFSLKTLID